MALETGTYISDLNSANPTSSDNKSQGDDHLRLIKATVKATFPNVSGAVTATHTELNLIDGVTATTAEINYLSGVTSAIQTQINAANTAITNRIPPGVIFPWVPGYFTDGSNGGYTYKLGTANSVAAGNVWLAANQPNFRICDGSNIGVVSGSLIFDSAGAYLPNLTDSRFLMGSTAAGASGGSNTMAHTHTHTHSAPAHYHGPGTLAGSTASSGDHTHLFGTTSGGGSGSGATANTIASYSGAMTTAGAHTHTVSVSGSVGATGSGINGDSAMTTGSDSSAASNTENRPLYLSCFYIVGLA